ncbi:MAG: hypothetical protein HY746_07920 [Elusimicrobia bacterium]|nr:hypothetical protein [Elusimicrobiota bacterium]
MKKIYLIIIAMTVCVNCLCASETEKSKVVSSADFESLTLSVPKTEMSAPVSLESKTAVPESEKSRNKIGTIKGGMNHSPVNVMIDKRQWTITGGINLSPINLKIDHETGSITGGANHSPVQLKFVWTPEEILTEGGANLSPVQLKVNWKQGILMGYSNHSPVKIEFDMKEGSADDNIVYLKGYANYSPVELQFDKVSGHLTGGMNYSPVDLYFENCDLYDFLQYFFVFLKKR